jgi:hypothetical protein
MAKRPHTIEQIIRKLREAEVALSKGRPVTGPRLHATGQKD